jgi:energy-coupling factor transport system ATP-binding protein
MPILELTDVTFSYPDSNVVTIANVSCKLGTGQFVVLHGSNGCGKSTLAKIMSGLLQPQSGIVNNNGGNSVSGWNGVGLLFQNPDEQLLAQNVEGEIAWGLENLGLPRNEMVKRVNETINYFNLTDLRQRPPESLSDGQKQLVALASIVVMRPSFLILDEATAFLDPLWKQRVRRYAQELSDNTGVLWITTRKQEIRDADEVWWMEKGELMRYESKELLS